MRLEEPVIEFVRIESTDVVTASGCHDPAMQNTASGTVCYNDGATANRELYPGCDAGTAGYQPILT